MLSFSYRHNLHEGWVVNALFCTCKSCDFCLFPLERPVADNERMFDVLQRFGSQRNEVRFFLRHERPPGRDTGR